MSHRIARQRIEIAVADPALAAALSAEASAAAPVMAAAIARGLDRVDDPDRIRRIDRVEIELPGWIPGGLATLAAATLADGIAAALAPLLAEDGGTAEVTAEVTGALAVVVRFARTGALGWPARDAAGIAAACHALAAARDPGIAIEVRALLHEPAAAGRLAMQLDDDSLCALIAAASGIAMPAIARLFDPEAPVEGTDPAVAATVPPAAIMARRRRIVQAVAILPPGAGIDALQALLARPPAAIPADTVTAASVDDHTRPPPAVRPPVPVASARPAPPDEDDPLPVDTAGTVLLWPLLGRLADTLGLFDPAGLLPPDPAVRERLARAFHFLAAANPSAHEAALPLAKLLAGLDPAALIGPPLPLAWRDRAAAAGLLDSAAGALGVEDGGDALRRTMLMRPGNLYPEHGGWRLHVDRRPGDDSLLDRLPWPLGWVRLPWMVRPLGVDW